MSEGRPYYAPIHCSTAITTAIDIFEILAGTNKPIRLHEIILDQTSEVGDGQEEQLEVLLKRITGSPTSGSGGPATTTPAPVMPNDTATGVTWENGNTTKLTGGTSVEISRRAWNVRQDFIWTPPPKGAVVIDQATRAVLELISTPADSITKIVGHLLYEEIV